MEDFRDRTLDRLVEFDERSRNFSAAVGLETYPFRSYTWACDPVLDQGREGACVGFAWAHELSARPKVIERDNAFALQLYRRAQQLDQWPGENYSGTSVLAGVKAVQEYKNSHGQSLVMAYRWGFGVKDVLKIVGYRGPVVLGINWYDNMYDPDSNNFIKASGEIAGGHAILMNGVRIVKKDTAQKQYWENIDLDKSWVRLHNSWGPGYGDNGEAFLTVRDLDKLLQEDGEACIPTLRSFD
jgi:hypothetical protein